MSTLRIGARTAGIAAASLLIVTACVGFPSYLGLTAYAGSGSDGSWAGRTSAPGAGGVIASTRTTSAGDGPDATLSDRQQRILRAADEILTTQNFVVHGTRYAYDCTGTILAVYAMAGIPVVDLFPRYSGNGVMRLFAIARDQGLLYNADFPEPGDLIFWDNTYDRNGDKLWNDELTHVGLVLSVDAAGTIEYIHHHYTEGVVRARMNLIDREAHVGPGGTLVNSPMRMRSHRYLNESQWLASHLYRTLGAMHRVTL